MVAVMTPTRPSPEPRPRWLKAADGVVLRLDEWGDDGRPPVCFAHGFGQTRHAWHGTAQQLARNGYHCHTADGRGHGDSGWVNGGSYTLDQFVDDATRLAGQCKQAPVWVGASMGGLLGMIAATEIEDLRLRALVLVDITPRWETRGVERIMAFMRSHPHGFASVHEAQDAVRAYLPHRANDQNPERLRKLLVPTGNGRLRWHWDPALLETVAAESARWSDRLVTAARQLRLPVLLISGGRSELVSERTVAEFQQLVPHAEHRCIADATHMVAGDANDRFTEVILDYLNRLP